MERIAALVEGDTEHHFILSTYARAIVQRPFPNGKSVTLDLIVESTVDAIETLGGGINHVVILLDREGRDISAAHMAAIIYSRVTAVCLNRSIYVGVTDRHIENWILADETLIRQQFQIVGFKYAGDGSLGKPALDQVSNKTLRSPRDKARLLKETSPTRSSQNSPSLKYFLSQINFNWEWPRS